MAKFLLLWESDVTRAPVDPKRVSSRFLRTRTLRKFANEKKYAAEAAD